jgi:hypothetical protein
MADDDDIRNRFAFHPAKNDQADRYELIRHAGKHFALLVSDAAPPSREQALALTRIEEAVMWAIAGIARHE